MITEKILARTKALILRATSPSKLPNRITIHCFNGYIRIEGDRGFVMDMPLKWFHPAQRKCLSRSKVEKTYNFSTLKLLKLAPVKGS